ncbi:D-alanyl-D-alanine carboxypeptidase family protein [Streptococcus phocae subsp. phocae]
MTKKIIALILTSFCFLSLSSISAEDIMAITRQAGYAVSDINRPKASIVVDAKSGDILWQDNIDTPRDPASLSKLFTLYLLFQDLAKGDITLDTTITATETDQAIASIYEISNNNIVAGVDYPIRDLISMTVVPSSNAATVMLANYLSANDASAFIDRINKTAEELGMENTRFTNASGAIAESFQGYYKPDRYDLSAPNVTTARDLAILIRAFINHYPDLLEFTNQSTVRTMVGTPYEEEFHSYNHSLPDGQYGLEGVDGIKTGSSPSAAFNVIVTAKRGQNRLITIVMGVGDWSDQNGEFFRHPFANALTEKGFTDIRELSKSKRQKLEKLNPHKKRHKHQRRQKENQKSESEGIELYIEEHYTIILICLVVFLVIVLAFAVVLFILGR